MSFVESMLLAGEEIGLMAAVLYRNCHIKDTRSKLKEAVYTDGTLLMTQVQFYHLHLFW